MEECVEVAHAVSKVIRFTAHDSYKIGEPTNLENLVKEFNELMALVQMLNDEGIPIKESAQYIEQKKRMVEEYMKYSALLKVVSNDSVA